MTSTPDVDCFGNVYKGDYLNGKRHGNGLLVYANGDSYKGEFHFDLPHGRGKYISNDGGNIYKGIWNKGILVQKTHVITSKNSGWEELIAKADQIAEDNTEPKQSNKVPDVIFLTNTENNTSAQPSVKQRLSEDTSNQISNKSSQVPLSHPRTHVRSSSPSRNCTADLGSCKNIIPSPKSLKSTSPAKSYVARRVRSISPSHNWTRCTSYKTIEARDPKPTSHRVLVQGLKSYSSPIKMIGKIEPPKRPAHFQSAVKSG